MTLSVGSTPPPDQLISRAINESVQTPPSTTREGVTTNAAWGWGAPVERNAFLPPFGTRQREHALRRLYRMEEQNLIKSAFQGFAKTIAALPWEITGDTDEDDMYEAMASARGWRLRRNNGVEYYQEVFRQANFGSGWGTLIYQLVRDFLRYDAGAYMEVIAPGDAYDKPFGAITGIAHIDPLRTYPTGDPRYPAIYYDRYGGIHVLHHARIKRFVDMEDGDELYPGYGESALTRALPVALRQAYMIRYANGRLDDEAPPGVDIYGGITSSEMQAAEGRYKTQQATDQKPLFGKRLRYYTPDASIMPKIESYDFSSAPEKFDWQIYNDMDVDMLAVAMGVDRQDIMQLRGGNIGSGEQSKILEQKSRGKGIGFFLQEAERKFNDILPDGFTFEWKQRNTQESIEDADKALRWAEAVAKMVDLTPQQRVVILSSEISAVSDAIRDAPRANDVFNQPMPVVAEDNAAGAAPVAPTQPPQQAQEQPIQPQQPVAQDPPQLPQRQQKDYYTTQSLFVQDVTDLLLAAISPNTYLNARSFGVTLRSLLKNYGYAAYRDGLQQGGVSVDMLDPDDQSQANRVFVEQSQYVSGLTEAVFKDKSITPQNAYRRAQLWETSLQAFNRAGVMSADANAMYRWDMSPLVEKHCPDCPRLNGQVHRYKTYIGRGIYPRSSKLKCRMGCGCKLTKTTEKARGRF